AVLRDAPDPARPSERVQRIAPDLEGEERNRLELPPHPMARACELPQQAPLRIGDRAPLGADRHRALQRPLRPHRLGELDDDARPSLLVDRVEDIRSDDRRLRQAGLPGRRDASPGDTRRGDDPEQRREARASRDSLHVLSLFALAGVPPAAWYPESKASAARAGSAA